MKDIIDVQKEADDSPNVEEMEIDEATEVWIKQQKRKPIKIGNAKKQASGSFKCHECQNTFEVEDELGKHQKTHGHNVIYNCDKCNKQFLGKELLRRHVLSHSQPLEFYCKDCGNRFQKEEELGKHAKTHSSDVSYNCEKCGKTFKMKEEFNKHVQSHIDNVGFKCDNCEENFKERDELNMHAAVHSQNTEEAEIKCRKCPKVYSNMSKLRRHDWRSHREIECNICGINLNCRQEISNHRKTEHQMFKKIRCKYYLNCIDEEECFFDHNNDSQSQQNKAGQTRYCPDGERCENQSCKFSEKNHSNMKDVLCRFQAKCNRSECFYKHVVERVSFLGDCSPNFVRK